MHFNILFVNIISDLASFCLFVKNLYSAFMFHISDYVLKVLSSHMLDALNLFYIQSDKHIAMEQYLLLAYAHAS